MSDTKYYISNFDDIDLAMKYVACFCLVVLDDMKEYADRGMGGSERMDLEREISRLDSELKSRGF